MVRACEMCPPGSCRPAASYCDADACYLCTTCDQEVHSANRLAQRHIRRRLTPAESCPAATAAPAEHAQSVEILFEDVPEYDFSDFGSLDAKMPSLGLVEDETMFASKSFSRGLASYLSWETMIPQSMEHVVPDFEPLSPEPTAFSAVEISPAPSPAPAEMDDDHVSSPTPQPPMSPVSPSPPSRSPPPVPVVAAKRPPTATRKANIKPELVRLVEVELQTPEQRKLLRMKALARFRSKRANRSFAKKVRYECRKQLADSRPRVKGRFVKKSEMALYRKYGALYRNHMHELAAIEAEDQCVPSL